MRRPIFSSRSPSDIGFALRLAADFWSLASCVFRVRELGGMRLVGFKCVKKDLGRKVTIDLGEAGTVYEFDTGRCLGKLSKIEIDSLDVPFKCYAVYKDAPSAPDPRALVSGRVYRLMALSDATLDLDEVQFDQRGRCGEYYAEDRCRFPACE